jgi:hypothetical protein
MTAVLSTSLAAAVTPFIWLTTFFASLNPALVILVY